MRRQPKPDPLDRISIWYRNEPDWRERYYEALSAAIPQLRPDYQPMPDDVEAEAESA